MSLVLASLITSAANIGYSELKDRQLRKQNRRLSKTYDDQITKLSQSVSGIEEFSEGLIELEEETSDIRRRDMFSDFLSKSEDITTTYEANIGKTDLATSGDVEEISRRERERLNRKIGISEDSESLTTEKNLLNILTSKEDSLASVRNEIFNLESAKAGLRT
tara:strand:- start:189 stop:677 length:489 start_codon:yes stop_codon:yes gene_type:complete